MARLEEGQTQRFVAEEFGVNQAIVSKRWQEYQLAKQGRVIHRNKPDNTVAAIKQEYEQQLGRQPTLQEIQYWMAVDYLHSAQLGTKISRALHLQANRHVMELEHCSEEPIILDGPKGPVVLPSPYERKLKIIHDMMRAGNDACYLATVLMTKKEVQAPSDKPPTTSPKLEAKDLTDEELKALVELHTKREITEE